MIKIQELEGRSFAKETLINYGDRAKLFIDAQRDTKALRSLEILESQGSQIVSESDDSKYLQFDYQNSMSNSVGDAELAQDSSQRARLNRIHQDMENPNDFGHNNQVKSRILPKEEPHAKAEFCGLKLQKCFKFCFAK